MSTPRFDSTDRPSIRVLLIEDNPGDAELVQRALRASSRGFTVQCCPQMSQSVSLLSKESFDVILADLSLPDSCGLETVSKLRQATREIAIVVLTSLASDQAALGSLDQGAQDYLVKDGLTAEVLERAIRHAIQRQQSYVEIQRLLGQVRQNQKLLENKNRRLAKLCRTAEQFVDNVSHEFRTPLTVVKEYASLVRDELVGPINAEQGRFLDIIGDRTDDLSNMVDDMLDVSKLEAGLLGVWRKCCRVSDILARVLPGLERKATIKQVALEWEIDESLPAVYCDPEKIGRVITNLVVNGIKFCREPGLVQIRADLEDAADDVRISITDNGPGIEREDVEKIFQRFKQLNNSVRGSTKGFGLGLGIAKELVLLNFGAIDVESAVGQRSCFSFTVPLARPVAVVRRYLQQPGRSRNVPSTVSLVEVEAHESDLDRSALDDAEAFLTYVLQSNDFVFRASANRWLVILTASAAELRKFFAKAEKTLRETNRNRPHGPLPQLTWTTRGSWDAVTQSSTILEEVEQIVETGELTYA